MLVGRFGGIPVIGENGLCWFGNERPRNWGGTKEGGGLAGGNPPGGGGGGRNPKGGGGGGSNLGAAEQVTPTDGGEDAAKK